MHTLAREPGRARPRASLTCKWIPNLGGKLARHATEPPNKRMSSIEQHLPLISFDKPWAFSGD